MKKVTVLGGGTGSYVVLTALKTIPNIDIAAIVAMTDNGGSTGKLRDQLGVLPPGDLRQCLVALSEAPELWRKLFTYRFESGDFKGHNFGNIFLSALEKVSDNYDEVLDEVHFVMQVVGRVIPVTYEKAHLKITYESGRTILGEELLDEENPDGANIVKAELEPEISASFDAINRILDSDIIIAGPGDLYASIISLALAKGVKDAIVSTEAKLIFIQNLMTKSAQTKGYSAERHLADFAEYFGRVPDGVLLSSSPMPEEVVKWYHSYGEEVVVNDLKSNGFKGKIVTADLIDTSNFTIVEGGKYKEAFMHSLLRHDADKLREILLKIIF